MTRRPPRPSASLVTPLLCLLLFVVAAAPAAAQKSDAEIQDDIAFAKGLARDWGFVDLATDVIEGIEREGVPSRRREQLGVTKCEIFEVAAINERDRVRRNELFGAALGAYQEFIENNPVSGSLAEAEAGFVRLSAMFARSLEISLEDAVGEEAEALRQSRIDVLTQAVAKAGDLISELNATPDKSERQKAELAELMLNRGRMLLDLGRTQEEGSFSFQQAISILEEVVFDFGEGTPPALRAYDLIGQVFAAQQEWSSARDFFEAVVEMALPSDPEAWKEMVREQELTQPDKEKRWLFVELSTEGLAEAHSALGNTPQACKYALHLYNTQIREGFAYSPQLGYPSLLAAARTLLESGGWVAGNWRDGEGEWYATEEEAKEASSNKRNRISCVDLALRIAQQVNDENKGNVLQIRAQKLISEIISRPGVVVAPEVLYEAAEGDYNERNNDAALAGFRRVLRSLEGQGKATRLEFGPKIFFRIGRTYQRMERPLEAAMAFQEGCTTWVGDPEYDSSNAQGFYRSMQDVVRYAPGDAELKALLTEAEELAAKLSEQDKDQINFNLGRKADRERNYATAIKYYGEVQPASFDYEKALVNIAVCKLKSNQTADALKLFDEYIDQFVKDPKNDPGASQAKAAKRQDALAKAEFYRGLVASKRAEKAAEKDPAGVGDPALWQTVIDLLDGYQTRYPEQTGYAPASMRSVMLGYLALGKIPEARAIYRQMVADYPDSTYSSSSAVEFHRSLKGMRDTVLAAGEVDRATELLREMAELLEFGNTTGGPPSVEALRAESRYWMELEEWAKAEVVLERLRTRFGRDPDQQVAMKKYILPDLAHALLELQKVSQARDILVVLIEEQEDKPTKRTVLDYCRAVTGWVEGEGTDILMVHGAGQTEEEFDKATRTLDSIANAVDEKWTCEWYAFKFQLAYGYYVWATADWSPNKDSRKKDTARKQLNALVLELGAQFNGKEGVPGVDDSCAQAEGELAATFGSDRLRRRLVWLWGKVQ